MGKKKKRSSTIGFGSSLQQLASDLRQVEKLGGKKR